MTTRKLAAAIVMRQQRELPIREIATDLAVSEARAVSTPRDYPARSNQDAAPRTQATGLLAKRTRDLPRLKDLGLTFGEVVHDLRSALDHMAWQLAIQHSGWETVTQPNIAPRIQFPISRTENAFRSHPAARYFSNEAITAIDPFHPYHNGPPDPVNPLLVIQRLSNTDKRQALTPSTAQLPLGDIRVRSSEPQAEIETVAKLDTIIETSAPVLRILASPGARIEIEPLHARVGFGTDVTGTPDFIFPEKINFPWS